MKAGARLFKQHYYFAVITLMALLAVLNYWPVVFGKIPLPTDSFLQFPPWETLREGVYVPRQHGEMGDLVTQFYPWRVFAADAVKSGVLPLWNPYVLFGAPFAANAQSSLFNPLNAIYYLIPTYVAYSVGFIIRTILTGLFTVMFARSLGVSKLGAMASGTIFAFSGFSTVWQAQPLGDSAMWLPLVLLAIQRLRCSPSLSSVVLAGLAFSMPWLAGHPETAMKVSLVGFVFGVYRLAWAPVDAKADSLRLRRYALLAGGATILGLALAAVQILPTLEWLGQINRSLDHRWGARPLGEILTFLSRDIARGLNSAGIGVPEGEAYAGILTLLVAPLALLHRNRRDAIFLALMVLVSVQIVYGFGPLYSLSQNLLVVRGMKNSRLILAVTFGLAVLAGFGVSFLEEYVRSGRLKSLNAAVPIVLSTAFAVCAFGVAVLIGKSEPLVYDLSLLHRSSLISGLVLIIGGILLFLVWARCLGPKSFWALTLLILVADLVSFSHGYIPFASAKEVFPKAPAFNYVKGTGDAEDYRILALNSTFPVNFNMMYGLSSAEGYDTTLARTAKLLWPLSLHNDRIDASAEKVVAIPDRRLDLMNVRYLVATTYNSSASALSGRPDRFRLVFTDGGVRVFENTTVLTRGFLVPASGVEQPDNEDAELKRVTDPQFDPLRSVVVSGSPAFQGGTRRSDALPDEPAATMVQTGLNETTFRTQVTERSILVVSQAYYPGWKVEIDGAETSPLRVNYAFTGVALEPGDHVVRLVYRPLSFLLGLAMSGVAVMVVIGLLAVGITRRWTRHPITPIA